MIKAGLAQLLTLLGLITYPTTLGGTTIDLAFAIDIIANYNKPRVPSIRYEGYVG